MNKISSKLSGTYIVRNWKKGVITFGPIFLTVWVLYKLAHWVIGGYLGLTEGMAETVVFNILDLHPNNSWTTWSLLTGFHLVFLLAVLGGLFLLAEFTTDKNQERIEHWVERALARIPPGSIVYKALQLVMKMLGGHEDQSLISAVCLVWQRDGAGHITFRSGYVVGDGEEKLRSEEKGLDTLITVYFGHTPNPSSGNGVFVRKAQVILTELPIGTFATQNAMLGYGLCDQFQPYADRLLAELRQSGMRFYGDDGEFRAAA